MSFLLKRGNTKVKGVMSDDCWCPETLRGHFSRNVGFAMLCGTKAAICASLISVTVINRDEANLGGERVDSAHTLTSQFISKGSQDKNSVK